MEVILQCTEVGVGAPKPDQNSRQISCLESPPGRAALQPSSLLAVAMGLVEGSGSCDSSGSLLWVEDWGVGGGFKWI